MKLSKNFSLKEFTKSMTATRLGIDNTPQDEHLEWRCGLFVCVCVFVSACVLCSICLRLGFKCIVCAVPQVVSNAL